MDLHRVSSAQWILLYIIIFNEWPLVKDACTMESSLKHVPLCLSPLARSDCRLAAKDNYFNIINEVLQHVKVGGWKLMVTAHERSAHQKSPAKSQNDLVPTCSNEMQNNSILFSVFSVSLPEKRDSWNLEHLEPMETTCWQHETAKMVPEKPGRKGRPLGDWRLRWAQTRQFHRPLRTALPRWGQGWHRRHGMAWVTWCNLHVFQENQGYPMAI